MSKVWQPLAGAQVAAAALGLAAPRAASGQGPVVTQGPGWPIEWLLALFALFALAAALVFVILLVRWRPPSPGA